MNHPSWASEIAASVSFLVLPVAGPPETKVSLPFSTSPTAVCMLASQLKSPPRILMPDSIQAMRPVFFVKDSEAETARKFEKRILDLPLMSGILFVGVSVEPAKPGKPPVYCFWVGCHRDFEESTAVELVKHTLRGELEQGMMIKIQAHRGIGRSFLEKR
jgi:hypothetical protein